MRHGKQVTCEKRPSLRKFINSNVACPTRRRTEEEEEDGLFKAKAVTGEQRARRKHLCASPLTTLFPLAHIHSETLHQIADFFSCSSPLNVHGSAGPNGLHARVVALAPTGCTLGLCGGALSQELQNTPPPYVSNPLKNPTPSLTPHPCRGPGAGTAPAEKEDATPMFPLLNFLGFFFKKNPKKIGMSAAEVRAGSRVFNSPNPPSCVRGVPARAAGAQRRSAPGLESSKPPPYLSLQDFHPPTLIIFGWGV